MARRRGFTLLEGLVASVVLLVLVLGVTGSISTAYQQSQSTRASSTAVTLARQLVDEIVSKPFDSGSLGPISGSRSTFTDVNAYNGYLDNSDSILPLGLVLPSPGTIPNMPPDYSRQVSVVVGAAPSVGAASTDFAVMTVSVTCPEGQIISIPEFVANYPILRQ